MLLHNVLSVTFYRCQRRQVYCLDLWASRIHSWQINCVIFTTRNFGKIFINEYWVLLTKSHSWNFFVSVLRIQLWLMRYASEVLKRLSRFPISRVFNVLAQMFWRHHCGAAVSAPACWHRDILVPWRFDAKTVWRKHFGAEIFWRWNILAVRRFGAGNFWCRSVFHFISNS